MSSLTCLLSRCHAKLVTNTRCIVIRGKKAVPLPILVTKNYHNSVCLVSVSGELRLSREIAEMVINMMEPRKHKISALVQIVSTYTSIGEKPSARITKTTQHSACKFKIYKTVPILPASVDMLDWWIWLIIGLVLVIGIPCCIIFFCCKGMIDTCCPCGRETVVVVEPAPAHV